MTQLTFQAVKDRLAGEYLFQNSGKGSPYDYDEYKRERRGFLQRIVLYSKEGTLVNAVLRTKATPSSSIFSVYDVEHLLAKGVEGLSLLLDAADQHLEQFELSGPSSFFANNETALAHQDIRYPVEVSVPCP
jgi:hypothetical protein